MASSLVELIINRLVKDDEITDGVGAHRLPKYWPPALDKWSTKAVRNAFYSSPALPRLLKPDSLKRTIADAVTQGIVGYARETASGSLTLEHFIKSVSEADVEFADDEFLLKADDARKLLEPPKLARLRMTPEYVTLKVAKKATFTATGLDQYEQPFKVGPLSWSATGGEINERGEFKAGDEPGAFAVTAKADGIDGSVQLRITEKVATDAGQGDRSAQAGSRVIQWSGTIPPQKWMNFYTKVVSMHAANPGLRLTVSFEVPVKEDEASSREQEVQSRIRELGLNEG